MTRSSFRPMASLGLVAAVLVYVGCSKTPESTDRPIASIPQPVAEAQAPPKKVEPAKAADRKSTRLNSSHLARSRMPSSA